MSNLFASLRSASGALSAFTRALDVAQNNVTNASTPGYAKQRVSMEALPFQPAHGLSGGVVPTDLQSSRDNYADGEVRRQLESLGYFEQKSASLAGIENNFDVSGRGGIAAALSGLFQSFSAWSVTPNQSALRRNVLDAAGRLAQAFQQSAASLAKASADSDMQLRQTVDQINTLAGRIRGYNAERLRTPQQDPGLDAKVHATLEELAELVDFTALRQPDGTVTVLVGGQRPLVIGEREYDLAFEGGRVLSASGDALAGEVSRGKLAALFEVRNRLLPSLRGDAGQPGDLNRLAKAVADRVNQLLMSGRSSDGPPPQAGVALFVYDQSNPAGAASTLAVNPDITPEQLAAIDPGPPYSSNGIALKLADLSTPTDNASRISGLSYAEFYGQMAARVGRELSGSHDGADVQKQLVAQARSLRDRISGVSLDEEAIHLIQFQRAYQATARMVTVLDELTETTVNLLR